MSQSEQINLFNPKVHFGYLPIRVLPATYEKIFLEIEPDFKNDLKYAFEKEEEIIRVDISPLKITNVADVSNEEITVYDNYNQFLWSI